MDERHLSSERANLLSIQRAYFETGVTLPCSDRRRALRNLETSILRHKEALLAALQQDLGKSKTEGYISEIGLLLREIRYIRKRLSGWMRPERRRTPLSNFPGRQWVERHPYGVVLVLSPWNYPVLLTLSPLVGALAAGNCCVLKPSELAPATSEVVATLIEECFPKAYVSVVNGGIEVSQELLEQPFNYIFYTGNGRVGRYVMERAAQHLTPVTLELGGKSPVIVTRTASLRQAARRIVFGKYLNCGQTCIAPDYILVEACVHAEFVQYLQEEIESQYGEHPLRNRHYGHIIHTGHYERLKGLLLPDKVVWGGETNDETLQISPTLLDNVPADALIMQEEIFGPLLPILEVENVEAAINFVRSRPHPLALYLFTKEKMWENHVMHELSFGGGCINDVLSHIASVNLPFGGVGASGMGAYHGRSSFNTFSHTKSILKRGTWWDPRFRYAPYSAFTRWLLRKVV